MNEPRNPKLYRPNVGLALFHANGLVFLGRRQGADGPYQWQMPQGGVDRGESAHAGALREMEEEIGVRPEHIDLLEETPDWLYYDFPTDLRKRMRGRYQGQRQKWFAFRFKGRDADIKLDTHTPEFSDWRWAPLDSAASLVIPFKRATYEEVARRFKKYSVGDMK